LDPQTPGMDNDENRSPKGKEKMRILLAVSDVYHETGGIQAFNNHLINGLSELGHRLCILSMNDINSFSFTSLGESREFECCGNHGYLKKPSFLYKLINELYIFKPDLIICGHANFSIVCFIVKKLFKIPYLTICHGVEVWKLNSVNSTGLKNSSMIVSVSRFTEKKISEQLKKYSKDRYFILPNTIDENKFVPGPRPKFLMERHSIAIDDEVLLTLGRLERKEQYKGHDKIIESLRHILKVKPNIKYVIAGSGDDTDRIKEIICTHNLENNVILTGFVPEEEIAAYYNLCDIFVMPSKGEGFGIVFLEALACGKPVVGGNKDGTLDALADGELGYLVDPDNIDEIKDTIIKILDGEEPHARMVGILLRKRMLEIYGIDRFKDRLKLLLEQVQI